MSDQRDAPLAAGDATYASWLGKEEASTETIDPVRVAALAATLDLPSAPAMGEPLPPGWQWLFFNPIVRRSGLGADGHPKRGGFLPPIDLPRRMWAGSRITYREPLIVGRPASRRSRITQIADKTGRRGPLWFVTVEHVTSMDDRECVIEQQDIVYRGATPPGAPAPTPEQAPQGATWEASVDPDTTLLFRYSALTFNGHKIHYDQQYAQREEGYPDLVVHGPLAATLLQQFALQQHPGRRLATFNFRGVYPLHVGRPFTLQGRYDETGALDLWTRGPNGELATKATATLA
jgi:3-methylfumaryl-CoA hydratase